MNQKRTTYSLAQLSQSLERFIRDKFALQNYWVVAEITRVQEKNGHRYLELADSAEGKRVAEMAANMWFSTFNRVNNHLGGELNRIFTQGNKVLINVRIEFHPIFGLKLNILDVDPAITYGEIEKKKKETIARLKKEGLFQLQSDLHLPAIIKRIALIGSPNTSGFRDFLSELTGNSVFTNFKVKTFPASVQGDNALREVVKAIEQANGYDVEVIIIVRGGGSKMDLNVFNAYEIAAAIAQSRLPVITGIGHETDEVVADLVARKKEITPTAVAKFLYVRAGVFKASLQQAFDGIIQMSQHLIAGHKEEFTHTGKYLVHFTQNLLREHNNRVKDSIHELHLGVSEVLENQRSGIKLELNKIKNHAVNFISLKRSTELFSRLDKVKLMSENKIDKARIQLSNLSGLLDLLNPEALLKKGYTISTIDDIDITGFEGELMNAELKTLSDKHVITSKITNVKTTGDETGQKER